MKNEIKINRTFRKNSRPFAECLCFCGKEFSTRLHYITSGHTKSCGCLLGRNGSKTHGMTYSREYSIWSNMKDRCLNPRNKHYKNYGGRGIAICERWKNSFENFYSDMGNKPPGMSLERKDNELGYSPDNCIWANWKDQCNNRRSNVLINIEGQEYNIQQLADKTGIAYSCLWSRYKKGKRGDQLIAKSIK